MAKPLDPSTDPAAPPSGTSMGWLHKLSASWALPEVLGDLCDELLTRPGLDRATVFDLRAGPLNAVLLVNRGGAPETAERAFRFGFQRGAVPAQAQFDAGQVAVVRRADAPGADELEWLRAIDAGAAALCPLRDGDAIVGALLVSTNAPDGLDPAALAPVLRTAREAATAVVIARLLRGRELTAGFRAALTTLAVQLTRSLDRAKTLQLLCSRGRRLFQASWGRVLLLRSDRLEEVAADGTAGEPAEPLVIDAHDPHHPAARALASGEVVFARPADGGPSSLAVPAVAPDGPLGVLHFRNVDPALAGEGAVIGALAAAVIRNQDLLGRLNRANNELKQVNVLKDRLIANTSHDLRATLHVIIGYAQLAVEGMFGEAPPELHGIIQRMLESASKQLALAEDLLSYSRSELAATSVNLTAVPLAPLLGEMEFLLSGLVQDRDVTTTVEKVPDELAVVADQKRLRQILTNLISNAAKFTKHGTIQVSVEATDNRVTLAVHDTGKGISPQDQLRIFEPFSQLEENDARRGAGLGLAIAKQLVKLMNGSLTVSSTVGEGSTFRLSLPRAQ